MVLKDCAPQLFLMRFLLFISLYFLLWVVECKQEERKWLSLVFFLVWLSTSYWDMAADAPSSLRLSRVINSSLPFCSYPCKTWFCWSSNTWYKEKYPSLLCCENGSILNLVLFEGIKYSVLRSNIKNYVIYISPTWRITFLGYRWCLGTSLLISELWGRLGGKNRNLVFHPRDFWWWQECELVFVQGGRFLGVDLGCLKPGIRRCLGLSSLIIFV